MKTAEADILEVEDPAKKVRSQKAFEALNHIFSGKENGLIDSVLKDYTPVTKIVNGQEVTKAPGLSLGTIFKAIGFAIRNPGYIGSLYSLYKSPEIIQAPAFQDKLLNNDNTWKFIGYVGEKLPQIGKVLDYFKFPEFAEGNILDSKGLKALSNVLTSKEEQGKLKEIALESRKTTPDMNKTINNILDLMQSQGFSDYINTKGVVLQNYIVKSLQAQKGIDGQLSAYGLKPENLQQITSIVPILLNNPKALKSVYGQFSEGRYTDMVKELLVLSKDKPEIIQYFKDNQDLFVGVIDKIVKTTPGLEGYDLKGDLYKIVPNLLEHPDKLISLIALYEKGKYPDIGKEFLGMIQEDKNLKQYFTENSELFKRILVDKAMGMKSYGVKDEVSEIFTHVMSDQNIPRVQGLLDKHKKGDWLGLATDTCRMIEEDPKFAKYMRDNQESFSKIVTAIVDSYPAIKTYTGNLPVGELAANLLKDPKSIREVIEGYQKGGVTMVTKGAKFLAQKALDSQTRGAVLGIVGSWVFGDGIGKQEVINRIPEAIIEVSPPPEGVRVSLNDAAKAVIAAGDDISKKQELTSLIERNILFDGVTVGSSQKQVKLENIDINNSFVNSKFTNVSFQGSKFTNASFTGATFENVDFSNTELDGITFQSLIPALKSGAISLKGAKVVGSMPYALDLSDISLQGIDLSGVTSMAGVNLKNTDFRGTVLPRDEMALRESYNLTSATFDSDMSDLQKKNQKYMMDLITDSIISRAEYLGDLTSDPKLLRKNIEELYISDSPMGAELRKLTSQNPDIVKYKSFPLASSTYNNTSDLSTTGAIMTLLYENRNDSNNIQAKLAANVIADQVTEKLFGQGANRGKDGYMIREACQMAIQVFLKENPEITAHGLVNRENLPELVSELAADIHKKTKYTTAGLVSGGIYLPDGAITEELLGRIAKQMNDSYHFSKAELEEIREVAHGIGYNLFSGGEKGKRKEDTALIFESLKEVILEIKKEHRGIEVADILKEKRAELVGGVDSGYFSVTRTGLTKEYYQNTSYTTVGLASGGIYLDPSRSKDPNFLSVVKEFIAGLVGSDIAKKEKTVQGEITTEKSLKELVGAVVSSSVEGHISSKGSSQTFSQKPRSSSQSQVAK